jgi:cytochrome c-type biogenesis protein CcmH/NrfF
MSREVRRILQVSLLSVLVTRVLATSGLAAKPRVSVRAVEAALRCPTFQGGPPLTEATGPLAVQMEKTIRSRVAMGWTRARIVAFCVHELGPQVRVVR